MKLVINALQYKQNSSGIGVCIRELFGELVAITSRPCTVVLSKDSPDFPVGEQAEQMRSLWDNGQKIRRILFQSIRMGRTYCRDALLLTTDSKTPLFLPRSCRVLPLVTDLALYRMPEAYQKSRILLWKAQYRIMKKHVVRWLAVSEFSKQDLTELLGIKAEDIDVVYASASENYCRVTNEMTLVSVRKKHSLPDHYVLFVGNFNPRKNLERLAMAFDAFKERTNSPHKLVVIGEQGWKFDKQAALSGLKHREDILFPGFVPNEDMPAIYSMADLFVFPTLYEGFGIPVIEAQRCGIPVLTSSVSALPEVAGNGALYVDPYSTDDISSAIEKILTNKPLAEALVNAGYENAKRFSWKTSAKRLDEIIESVMRYRLLKNI